MGFHGNKTCPSRYKPFPDKKTGGGHTSTARVPCRKRQTRQCRENEQLEEQQHSRMFIEPCTPTLHRNVTDNHGNAVRVPAWPAT